MILPNSPVLLDVRNLHANINGTPILKGLNLTIRRGEVHAIIGRPHCVRSDRWRGAV